ncbi:regulator of chromosome condensation domain-containing protein [Cavenderia fasciculata]|uniref:Regulator of chromosome condensation domain-containing protein n=1 Tax=Cavenderia fasciculata TaxID=261658 RepID=F4QDN8_CACFS|nr:regulator of chromosome condensation domain-containing protein [Cavenderia fasciculata]EGG13835.1 regulator of chromosome condensation domain-containing protein [Cavenderia fasciculata]|eukprot:XP_004350543.1 regulator of chromosome condensation domain-containing protein [Cavenderia fasciculata]
MSIYSFGLGINGELGQGDTCESLDLPKKIQFFSDINKKVKKISCGSYHTVFITDDEELYLTGIGQDPKTGSTLFALDSTLSKSTSSPLSLSKNGASSGVVDNKGARIPHSLSTRSLLKPSNSQEERQLQGALDEFHEVVKTNGPPSGGSTPPLSSGGGSGSGTPTTPPPLTVSMTQQNIEYVKPRTIPTHIPLSFIDRNHPANKIKQVSLGNYHIVILTEGGNVWSWGTNTYGQLGIGSTTHSNHPKMVELKCVKSIATGVKHTAAINEWGELYMWGINEQGELGLGDTNNRLSPTRVSRLKSEFMQRNFLRQLNVLNNVYYKSFMSIATPSDPAITQQLLFLSNQGSGSGSDKSGSADKGAGTLSASGGGGGGLSSSRDLNSTASSGNLSPVVGPTPITTGGSSHSTPNLMSGSGTIRSRSTSMATIRGFLGLNAMANTSIEDNVSVTEEEVIGIFSDIRSLIKSTQILLSKLDQRIDTYDPEIQILGDIFLEESVLSSYRCYIPFSDNYNSACMTLFNVKRRSEKVATLLKECEKRSQTYGVKLDSDIVHSIDLKSLLLSPLQNIPRIFMMLGELSMSTSPKHKDIELLNQSAGKFQVLFERINQNFQFVEAIEILNCSSNEYGNPQVMGGSLKQLVEKLTHHNISDPYFVNVFLLTFRNFSKPLELLDLLIEKYEKYPVARGRVVNVLSNWIINYFYDFENDPIQTIIDPPDHHPEQLSQKLEKFLQNSITDKLLNSAKAPYEAQRKKDFSTRYNAISVIIPTVVTPPTISLLDFSPIDICQTLTILNHLYYAKIDRRELLNQRWTKKKAPNIQASTDHFNRVSQLVVTEIVQCKNSKSRATVIAHFLAIAQGCFELNNFTGVAAIIYGLNNATVSKLKKTWSKLSKDSFNTYEYLEKIVTPMKNYISLRHIMATVQPPCTPFIGTYLKDLTFIEDGNPPQIGGLINFYKQRKISEVIFQIQQFQQVLYTNITPNITIRDYLLAAPLLEEKKAQSMASGYE